MKKQIEGVLHKKNFLISIFILIILSFSIFGINMLYLANQNTGLLNLTIPPKIDTDNIDPSSSNLIDSDSDHLNSYSTGVISNSNPTSMNQSFSTLYDASQVSNTLQEDLTTNPTIHNYLMITGDSDHWYDAKTNGISLYIYTFGVGSVSLPFLFQYYNENFSTLYISNAGWLSFYNDVNYNHHLPPSQLPISSFSTFSYFIAPFWDYIYSSTNTIYVWNMSDRVIIEFYNMEYLNHNLAGTFEVVLFVNNTLEFIYQHIDNFENLSATSSVSTSIGLNYGDGIHYNSYSIYDLVGISNFSMQFVYNQPIDALNVTITAPQFILDTDSTIVTATLTNIGVSTQTNIPFDLYLNDTLVNSTIIASLDSGTGTILTYSWNPAGRSGTFHFIAISPSSLSAPSYFFQNNSNIRNIYSRSAFNNIYGYITDLYNTPVGDVGVIVFDTANSIVGIESTNLAGYYNITGLMRGQYTINVNKTGYVSRPISATVFFDTLEEQNTHYLNFSVQIAPPRILTIYTPINNSNFNGSYVQVDYSITDFYDLARLVIYVNEINRINITQNYNMTLRIPVFSNGTNVIKLIGIYYDYSQISVSVTVMMKNVIPIIQPEIGDYMTFKLVYNSHISNVIGVMNHYYAYSKITFTNWVTPMDINISQTDFYYFTGLTDPFVITEWFEVNILNGYISDSSSSLLKYTCLEFLFSGLNTPRIVANTLINNNNYYNGNNIGDRVYPTNTWNTALAAVINGSNIWDGRNVWTVSQGINNIFYFDKYTGILLHNYYNSSLYDVETNLVNSSFLPLLKTIPQTSTDYYEGATGNSIGWTATSNNPTTYVVTRNDTVIENGSWSSDQNMNINIDGLSTGIYIYMITINDINGDNATTNIVLTVLATVQLTHPSNISYVVGTSGHTISWLPQGAYPTISIITRNSTVVSNSTWISGVPITIGVDGLEVGIYFYIITIFNAGNQNVTDSISVMVISSEIPPNPITSTPPGSLPTPTSPAFNMLLVLGTFLVIVSIKLYVQKQK